MLIISKYYNDKKICCLWGSYYMLHALLSILNTLSISHTQPCKSGIILILQMMKLRYQRDQTSCPRVTQIVSAELRVKTRSDSKASLRSTMLYYLFKNAYTESLSTREPPKISKQRSSLKHKIGECFRNIILLVICKMELKGMRSWDQEDQVGGCYVMNVPCTLEENVQSAVVVWSSINVDWVKLVNSVVEVFHNLMVFLSTCSVSSREKYVEISD